MVKVRYGVYSQSEDMWGDVESEWEETYEDEYATREEAERNADKHPYGCLGQYVEIFIDDKFYDDYEVEEDDVEDEDDDPHKKVIYQVVFLQGNYENVDYETENYDQAQEVMRELQAEMTLGGERNFCYVIREVKR